MNHGKVIKQYAKKRGSISRSVWIAHLSSAPSLTPCFSGDTHGSLSFPRLFPLDLIFFWGIMSSDTNGKHLPGFRYPLFAIINPSKGKADPQTDHAFTVKYSRRLLAKQWRGRGLQFSTQFYDFGGGWGVLTKSVVSITWHFSCSTKWGSMWGHPWQYLEKC